MFEPIPIVAIGLALMAGVHCGEGPTTGRERIGFGVSVRGVHPEFDASTGWHVVLDQATLAVGPVRWYEGAPLFGAAPSLLESLVGLRAAHAHPGHYVAGEALADLTTQHAIDLISGVSTQLSRAEGVSGTAMSATLGLRPPGATLGPAGTALGTNTLRVRGTATRAGATVRFQIGLRLDVDVRGIPASGVLSGTQGAWEISVDLARWLDRADFSAVVSTSDGAPTEILATDQPGNALYRGATSATAYGFSATPGASTRDE